MKRSLAKSQRDKPLQWFDKAVAEWSNVFDAAAEPIGIWPMVSQLLRRPRLRLMPEPGEGGSNWKDKLLTEKEDEMKKTSVFLAIFFVLTLLVVPAPTPAAEKVVIKLGHVDPVDIYTSKKGAASRDTASGKRTQP